MTEPTPTDAPTDALGARQQAAIQDSGWGLRFRLFQPRNAYFWLYGWAVVTGVLHTVDYFRQDAGNYGGALVGGVLAFALYGAAWLLFLGTVDRYTPESHKLLATGFVWGFFVATMALALTANGAVLSLYAKVFGQSWATDWSAGLTAPFTEETAKALGFVVLLGLAPRLIRSAYDAFVVGAFIGLGFQLSENVLYVYQGAQRDFGTSQVPAALQVIGVRSLSGIASHALFSAIFCAGLFWALGRGVEPRRIGRGLGLMVLAMLCHGVWDDTGAIGMKLVGGVGVGLMLPLLIVIEVAIVVRVARLASATERAWMHDLLAPEVASGLLGIEEVEALAGSRHHQRKYVKSVHGHHRRRVARHVLEAAHDLAEQIARSYGEDTTEVLHARAEVRRLRDL